MAEGQEELRCPHCGTALRPFAVPPDAGFDSEEHLACFNDDCPYYVEGWDWMMQNYAAKASYRYRVDPATGKASPIPVWSKEALFDRIIGGPHHK